jgi:hypothetical protein
MPAARALERLNFDVRSIRVRSAPDHPDHIGALLAFIAFDRFDELAAVSEEWGRHEVRSVAVQAGAHLVSQPPTPRQTAAGDASSVRLNRRDSEIGDQ